MEKMIDFFNQIECSIKMLIEYSYTVMCTVF